MFFFSELVKFWLQNIELKLVLSVCGLVKIDEPFEETLFLIRKVFLCLPNSCFL